MDILHNVTSEEGAREPEVTVAITSPSKEAKSRELLLVLRSNAPMTWHVVIDQHRAGIHVMVSRLTSVTAHDIVYFYIKYINRYLSLIESLLILIVSNAGSKA